MSDIGDEHDEGYFASMTDVMVGLLFIFIIIIMFFALQIGEAETDVVPRSELEAREMTIRAMRARIVELEATRESDEARLLIVEMRNGLRERDINIRALRARVVQLEAALERARRNELDRYLAAADARRAAILREVRDTLATAGMAVQIVEQQGVIRLPNDLLFAKGTSQLSSTAGAGRSLGLLADALSRVLPCYTRGPASDAVRNAGCNPSAAFVETVFVEGHTDADPVLGEIEPGVSDNLALSARRAANTYRALVTRAPALSKFRSVEEEPILNVAAYGASRPVRAVQDRNLDRRIDLRFLMHTPRSDTLERVQQLVGERQ